MGVSALSEGNPYVEWREITDATAAGSSNDLSVSLPFPRRIDTLELFSSDTVVRSVQLWLVSPLNDSRLYKVLSVPLGAGVTVDVYVVTLNLVLPAYWGVKWGPLAALTSTKRIWTFAIGGSL